MTQRRLFALAAASFAFLLVLSAFGDDSSQSKTTSGATANSSSASNEKLTSEGRMMIIRGLEAELGYARRPFPMGRVGVTLKNGTIADESKLSTAVASYGPALKPGDQARITQIIFKPKSIIFEINGGPERKKKWYEHIEIDGMGGGYTPGQNRQQSTENMNMHGSFVQLAFDNYVPNLNSDQVKKMLDPVLDFHAKSASEAYLDTVPPKVKAAIQNHQILVGMDHDMVIIAKGRPEQKIREKDPISGNEFEEWIYGHPPQEVQFVRFGADEVVRLEIMQVNGQKLIKTEKEIEAPKKPTVDVAQQGGQPQVVPVNRPSLRRPGEDGPDDNRNPIGAPRTSPSPQQIPPVTTPGGPGDPNTGAGRPSPTPGGPGGDIPQTQPTSQRQPPPIVTPPTRTTTPDNNGPPPSSTGPN